jgi:hypothetical protein
MAAAIRAETGIAPRVYCNRMIDLPARFRVPSATDPAAAFVASMARVAARQRDGLATLDELGRDRAGPVCQLPLVPTLDAGAMLDALADTLDVQAEAPA